MLEDEIETNEDDLDTFISFGKDAGLMLVKLGGYLESMGAKEFSMDLVNYGDCHFEIESYSIDDKATDGNLPFRAGVTIEDFVTSLLDEMNQDFLDDQGSEYTQRICLNLIRNNEIGEWQLFASHDDTVEDNLDEQHDFDEEHNEGDPAFAAIVKFMNENGIDTLKYSFSGCGDSGELNDLEAYANSHLSKDKAKDAIEGEFSGADRGNELTDQDRSQEQSSAFEQGTIESIVPFDFEAVEISIPEIDITESAASIISDHVDNMTENVGDWWNNSGGSGIAYIYANGTSGVDVTFYHEELETQFSDVLVDIPIKIFVEPIADRKKDMSKNVELMEP